MEQQRINKILEDHQKWLNQEGGSRADFRGADLRDADFRGADLRGAYFRGAYLRDADFRESDLRDTDFRGANLKGAYLQYADLPDTNFQGADLRGAYLRRAYFRGADLTEANLPAFQVAPEEGSFIAWKKGKNNVIKLKIPEDAERTSCLTSRKCRASKAKVLEILDTDGNPCDDQTAQSRFADYTYTEGQMAIPDGFDDDIRVECTEGIHFFITKKEAIEF